MQLQAGLSNTLSFIVDDLVEAVPVYSLQNIRFVEYVFRFTAPATIHIQELVRNLTRMEGTIFHIAQVSGEYLYHAAVWVDIT